MKRVCSMLILACLVLTTCAYAESNGHDSIAGSSARELMDIMENFGLPLFYDEFDYYTIEFLRESNPDDNDYYNALKSYGFVPPDKLNSSYESKYRTIDDSYCNYRIEIAENEEIKKAVFEMNDKDNGLFELAASLSYDNANPAVAKEFVKSKLKKGGEITIGDAKFTLDKRKSTAIGAVTFNGVGVGRVSNHDYYVLTIEHTDDFVYFPPTAVKVIKDVKVRASDSFDSECLGTAKVGELLVALKPYYSDGWHQVIYKDRASYVWSKYTEVVEQ